MRLINLLKKNKNLKEEFSHKPKRLLNFRSIGYVVLFIAFSFSFLHLSKEGFNLISKNNLSKDTLIEHISNQTDLGLKEIHVQGRENVSTELLLKTVNLKKGTPLLSVNIKEVQTKLNNIGWIKSSIVERKLPNTLLIKLKEYRPLALLQKNNEHYLISTDGSIITRSYGQFSNLPVIIGDDAEKYASLMLKSLGSEPKLFHQVWAISFISKRRWNVFLRSGLIIKLPEINPEEAWAKLAELNRTNAIISREIHTIDLRSPNNLIIEPGRSKKIHSQSST